LRGTSTARRLLITGRPGSGKSTLFRRVASELERLGCRVGGISAPEVREAGRRVGFLIVDLATGERAWLARLGPGAGPRVGRYTVNVEEAGRLGAAAVERALREADVVAIDEIGPMELLIPRLREAITRAAAEAPRLLAVVHARLPRRDPELWRLLRGGSRLVEVTIENRGRLQAMAGELAGWLVGGGGCGG